VLDAGFKGSGMGSVREQGQNAISTLLQPPIVRTGMLPHTTAQALSGHRPPSTRDIPPVTLTSVPHVEPTTFNPYLSQIGGLYDAFQRAKAEAESEAAQLLLKDSSKPNERSRSRDSINSLTSTRRPSGSKRGRPSVTPLSTIPNVYFDDNFHLENPRTFDIVSERSDVVRPVRSTSSGDVHAADEPQPAARKALATNAILQEKLSWYMDTVEVHLINAISTASTSFFAALGSLRQLQTEASESVAQIKELREDLRRLDEQMAIGGLKVVDMKRRRENLNRLANACHTATRQLRRESSTLPWPAWRS
jgi:vacuolar protein sorting-associated protein 54